MKNAHLAIGTLCLLAGTTLAGPRDTQTFPGPIGTFFDETDPANMPLTATFPGTGYTPKGVRIVMNMAATTEGSWANDITVTCTPPTGAAFDVVMSEILGYTTLTDVTQIIPFPAGVSNAGGSWTFLCWDIFEDGDGITAESTLTNVRISLEDGLPPVPQIDAGIVSGTVSVNVPVTAGGIHWVRFQTLGAATNDGLPTIATYLDIDTEGTPGTTARSLGDTELGLYNGESNLVAEDDDSGSNFHSQLTFGDAVPTRAPVGNGLVYDGRNGNLPGGTYYLAVTNFDATFGEAPFAATTDNISVTGTITLNFKTNIVGMQGCSVADVGVEGGGQGHDNLLNNNDFVAFIDLFFSQNAAADVGVVGGGRGSDGQWDNNDFVAFIDIFFTDAANCTG